MAIYPAKWGRNPAEEKKDTNIGIKKRFCDFAHLDSLRLGLDTS
jgi:hypothetical protein